MSDQFIGACGRQHSPFGKPQAAAESKRKVAMCARKASTINYEIL